MTGRYGVISSRIRQDLTDLETVVGRVDRSISAAASDTDERDLLIDSAALNLHDFYSGLERVFSVIASGVDQSVPSGVDWHRELLRQMTLQIDGVRPAVLSFELAREVDEYLRFRHVVRHVYAFELDAERVERLAEHLQDVFETLRTELVTFCKLIQEFDKQA